MRFVLASLACAMWFGCGRPPAAPAEGSGPTGSFGATSESERHDSEPSSGPTQASSVASAPSPGVPSACADASAPLCTPPGAFVERLCTKTRQDVALALFSKRTPFTRLYLRGKVDELAFEEEVLALRRHVPPKNGMVVGSAAGTYDLLRWDGSCAMGIEAEMITKTRPQRPVPAHVQWHRMAPATQDALIAGSDAVKRAHAKRGKECRGAMSGEVSVACQRADAGLVDAIVAYVREGGSLPETTVSE